MSKKVVIIGSMRYPELLQRARCELTQDGNVCIAPTDEVDLSLFLPASQPKGKPNCPVNQEKGHWHWTIDLADEVIVVRRPDGTLGAGTVDELQHAVGTGKKVIWASYC